MPVRERMGCQSHFHGWGALGVAGVLERGHLRSDDGAVQVSHGLRRGRVSPQYVASRLVVSTGAATCERADHWCPCAVQAPARTIARVTVIASPLERSHWTRAWTPTPALRETAWGLLTRCGTATATMAVGVTGATRARTAHSVRAVRCAGDAVVSRSLLADPTAIGTCLPCDRDVCQDG